MSRAWGERRPATRASHALPTTGTCRDVHPRDGVRAARPAEPAAGGGRGAPPSCVLHEPFGAPEEDRGHHDPHDELGEAREELGAEGLRRAEEQRAGGGGAEAAWPAA